MTLYHSSSERLETCS